MPKSRNPQLEKFEDRLLLSISPGIAGADAVDEGRVYEMQLSAEGDAVNRWELDWGDGTISKGTSNNWGNDISLNADGTWTATHVYADNMTTTINATAYDGIGKGNSLSYNVTQAVSVENTAPALTFESVGPMKEGRTYAIVMSSEDFGTDTITGWSVDWGDGNVSAGALPNSKLETATVAANQVAAFDSAQVWDPLTLDSLDANNTPTKLQMLLSHEWGDGIIQVKDNLWVVSHTYADDGSYKVTATATDEDGTHSVFGPAGSVDTNFGVDGKASADFGDGLDTYCREMLVDDSGRIVMVGYADDGTDRDYAIARFNKDGTADATFYGDGTVLIDGDSISGGITGGYADIAGLQIIANGDGASTTTDASLITSKMLDAMLQIEGVNAETDLLRSSIAAEDTTTLSTYGPLLPVSDAPLVAETLSTTDSTGGVLELGRLEASTTTVSEQPFEVTRLYDSDAGLLLAPELGGGIAMAMSTNGNGDMTLSCDISVDEGDVYSLNIDVSDLLANEEVNQLTIDWGSGPVITNAPSSGMDWDDGIMQISDTTWIATHIYPDNGSEFNTSVSADTNLDNTITGVPEILPGDANMDGYVDVSDLGIVASNYGTLTGMTWEDGNFTFPIDEAVDVSDLGILASNYGSSSYIGQVTVNNVAPVLTLSGTGTVDEGGTYTLNLESSDPGDDTITEWEIDWGNGSTETFTEPAQAGDPWVSSWATNPSTMTQVDTDHWEVTHVYADNGDYTINASATDEDGTWEAYASYGKLDTHFGEAAKGWISEDFGGSNVVPRQVIVQRDGKILVAGYGESSSSSDTDFLMVRYNSDGTLDEDFGDDGLVVTDLGGEDCCYEVALQPDSSYPSNDKIVLAGYSYSEVLSGSKIALARYTSAGVIDAGDPNVTGDGFGDNDTGFILEDFGGGYYYAYGLTILPGSGDIIVAGKVGNPYTDALFAKFDDNGILDTSFGNAGKLVFSDVGYAETANAVEVLWERQAPDNTVLVGAGAYSSTSTWGTSQGLFFFDTSGAPLTFGANNDGVIETNFSFGPNQAFSITIDRGASDAELDDRIITVGYISNSFVPNFSVARFDYDTDPIDDFVLDTAFDLDGAQGSNDNWIDFDSTNDVAMDVVTLPSGRIIAVGYARINSTYEATLVGLNASNGSLDSDFDTDGILHLDFGQGSDQCTSATVDQDGNILVLSH